MPWNCDFNIDKKNKAVIIDPKGSGPLSKPLKVRPDPSLALQCMLDLALMKQANPHFTQYHAKNQCYPVFGAPKPFGIDRNAACLFGIVAAGSHLLAYTYEGKGEDRRMKLWIPRRSYKKARAPGVLDNSVADDVAIGYRPDQIMLIGARDEAGLDPVFVSENMKAAGTVSYFHRTLPRMATISNRASNSSTTSRFQGT